MPDLNPIMLPELKTKHGFFDRHGGVSTGVYTSLNCTLSSNDVLDNVLENRRRIAAYFDVPAENLLTCYQAHTAECITVTALFAAKDRPRADGLVTNQPGILLGALAADCCPILLFDETHQVIGALHAGWRGAVGGIIQSTLNAMLALGATPATITAALGPCIHQHSYEVSLEFYTEFTAQAASNSNYFKPGNAPDKFWFDLPGYNIAQLTKAGVGQIIPSPFDTYTHPDRFFSHRRATHLSEAGHGGMLSVIGL